MGIGLVIGLILGGSAGYFLGADMTMRSINEQIAAEKQANVEASVNPLENVKTNPLEDVTTNPYENVKLNPFE